MARLLGAATFSLALQGALAFEGSAATASAALLWKPGQLRGDLLPNFDCHGNAAADQLLEQLDLMYMSVSLFQVSGSAKGRHFTEWPSMETEYDIWQRYAQAAFDFPDSLGEICPLGYFVFVSSLCPWTAESLGGAEPLSSLPSRAAFTR
eukprot:TRINITY_DN27189_c0_g1_i1.p1 TRINITY_DN27189_c0_g1~~TRINITY_DN27189_c0_g1_i1.p1  ORF type:complete len:150 (-),score=21.83 TRINITY_DN27189_c0_g1_i1:261-710(-)